MKASKQRAEARGRWAEVVTTWIYRFQGFRLLAWRYRTPVGEIDLVMRRGKLIVFIEVKARARLDDALHALLPHQRERLCRAAAIFLRDHPIHHHCDMRFDLMGLQPWRLPCRIINAWRLE